MIISESGRDRAAVGVARGSREPAKERGRSRIVLEGDMPSPANPPSGCRFRTRCPKFASGLTDDERSACLGAMPEFRSQGEDHDVACYYPERTAVF